MRHAWFWFTGCLWAGLVLGQGVTEQVGLAKDKEGNLLYKEVRRLQRDAKGTPIVEEMECFDANGKRIAEARADFSRDRYLPESDFIHHATGGSNQVKRAEKLIRITNRGCRTEAERQSQIKTAGVTVAGTGMLEFISDHLEDLAAGRVQRVSLILPTELDQFSCRILKESVTGDRLCLRIEIDSWFLRFFAPTTEAVYDLKTRQLLAYRGASNIGEEKGRLRAVNVEYTTTTNANGRLSSERTKR